MKKSELSQDKSTLTKMTRELCYVKNEEGKYETDLSTGWEAKAVALENAWEEIERRKAEALQQVKDGKVSPIVYFMEVQLMDLTVLAGYTGFYKWQIKRHFKPSVFKKLSAAKLAKYAEAFEIEVSELTKIN